MHCAMMLRQAQDSCSETRRPVRGASSGCSQCLRLLMATTQASSHYSCPRKASMNILVAACSLCYVTCGQRK
ncbi:hypothetical protein FA10DRAFT_95964 [Acaromyces ingoldii]|uniref:Uncharacterized protein n=1 Tax=Acaromyces ingoldii TaxID=215250 RepID=A0A316YU49_9BASI|nr:hypothetical protein FA10DRAFT_95964 [Acaromyces ingoldii]PWN92586.1 hypothetical protein FA10DRAFT_95964 [Acaromyces ingoldii]